MFCFEQSLLKVRTPEELSATILIYCIVSLQNGLYVAEIEHAKIWF